MSRKLQRDRRNIFTLVEEATHLLRRAPLSAWLAYHFGSLPFVVFLFFFWSDMSRSPLAAGRVLELSFLLALCYAWMKVWQGVFCDRLLCMVEGRAEPGPLPLRGWLRLIASQTLVHATMPWVLALAFVAVIPSAWAYAFYHNATILAAGHFRAGGRTKPLLDKALAQAHYAPLQNHYVMLVMLVFAVLVYMNFFVSFVLATVLAKSFTGSENAFTLHPMLYFSTSVQALLISLAYLVVNPFVKALYVIRCFQGGARTTGADITVALRALPKAGAAALTALLFLSAPLSSHAQEPPVVPDKELDQSIRDVLQGSEFQWRLPRESAGMADDSWLGMMLRKIGQWFDDSLEGIGKMLGAIRDWLAGSSGSGEGSGSGGGGGWLEAMPALIVILLVLLVAALMWLLWKNWRQSQQTLVAEAVPVPPEINLESENVVATQLPEDEWLRLAREKMAAGELRLALRALFLATLAHLGEKRLLQISRSKSNGDYVRELGWRTRDRAELGEGFASQVRTFDRVWYGWHEVTQELMARFEEQHERITRHAA